MMNKEKQLNKPGVRMENDQLQRVSERERVDLINTHFTLSIVAVCLSCLTGFFAVPLALAALIFSLCAKYMAQAGRTEDRTQAALWAGLFGWITVILTVLPILLLIFFGGALLAGIAALLSAM